MGERKITDKKGCLYCGSSNIHYLGYPKDRINILNPEKWDVKGLYDFKWIVSASSFIKL